MLQNACWLHCMWCTLELLYMAKLTSLVGFGFIVITIAMLTVLWLSLRLCVPCMFSWAPQHTTVCLVKYQWFKYKDHGSHICEQQAELLRIKAHNNYLKTYSMHADMNCYKDYHLSISSSPFWCMQLNPKVWIF